jgi:hypothetical protein
MEDTSKVFRVSPHQKVAQSGGDGEAVALAGGFADQRAGVVIAADVEVALGQKPA